MALTVCSGWRATWNGPSTPRLLDVNLALMLDQTPEAAERCWERLTQSVAGVSLGTDPYAVVQGLTFDPANAASIISLIAAASLLHRTDAGDRSAIDATHAWVEAWLPELGWVGFDPTNNLLAGDRHLRVAVWLPGDELIQQQQQ